MTYKKMLNDTMVAIIVGISCLVIGYVVGSQTKLPMTGLESASASQASEIEISPTGF